MTLLVSSMDCPSDICLSWKISPEIFKDMLGYLSLQMLVFEIQAGFALSRASTAQCPDSL